MSLRISTWRVVLCLAQSAAWAGAAAQEPPPAPAASAAASAADASAAKSDRLDRLAQQGAWLEQSGRPQQALETLKELERLKDEVRRDERARESARQRDLLADARRTRELERLKLESERSAAELAAREASRRLMIASTLAALLACAVLAQWLLLLRRKLRMLKVSRDALRDSSSRDPLTRLFNRRHAEAAMARWQATDTRRVALLLLDVDHFKKINDGHGHAAGDEVLKGLARRLEPLVRDRDVVARWGGEEFLLLLPGTELSCALAITRRLLSSVGSQAFDIGAGQVLRATVSVGVAVWPSRPGQSWAQALHLADLALYRSKANGRNQASAAKPLADGGQPQQPGLEAAPAEDHVEWITVAGPAVAGAAPGAAVQGGLS